MQRYIDPNTKIGKIKPGDRFGKLVVIKRDEDRNDKVMFLCKCDCGNLTSVYAWHLLTNQTKSCGCIVRSSENRGTHKLTITDRRLYNIFFKIKDRCYNKNSSLYKYYGSRGIKVCNEWLEKDGVEKFCIWAHNNGYNETLTIDRIDPNGDYTPSNCRWVDMKTQGRNRRESLYTTFFGEKIHILDLADKYNISYSTITERFHNGLVNDDLVKSTDTNKYYTYDNRKYTVNDLSKITGFSYSATLYRIKNYNSIQEVISKRTKKAPINAIYFIDKNNNIISQKEAEEMTDEELR